MRRSKTYVTTTFPQFTIEGTFPEEDQLWKADEREATEHVAQRAKEVLDHVFEKDAGEGEILGNIFMKLAWLTRTIVHALVVISVTAHSGFINGFLTAVSHKPYSLPTGGK
jgi:hypothetical protein